MGETQTWLGRASYTCGQPAGVSEEELGIVCATGFQSSVATGSILFLPPMALHLSLVANPNPEP